MKEHWITYVFEQFERIYGFKDWSQVSYGNSESASVILSRSSTGFFEQFTPIPGGFISQEWKEKEIPFLFNTEQYYPIIEEREGKVYVNLDVIAPSFYYLSGWQEFNSPHRDSIGRFPYDVSIQKKLDNAEIPVVNYYFDILKTAIERALNIELKVGLWNGKDSAVFLSHDIDKVNSGWMEGGFSELKKLKPLSALKVVSKKGMGTDVWYNFQEIAKLEAKYNAASAFFFLPEQGKYKGVENADYEFSDPAIQEPILDLEKRGWKVGIHGSYGTAFEGGKLDRELSKFPKRPTSNRFHFLSWEQRLTPQILESAGIKFDSTLGFSEHFGYRNGICHPFNLYDLQNDKMLEVIEYPLHMMDTTFQHKKYLNVKKEQVVSVFDKLHFEAKKFNGFTSVLWHNNFFSEYKYKGWKEVYEDILTRSRDSTFIS